MTSQKPYLIRAIHEWLLDNASTPYVLVNTEYDGVQVPTDFVRDGRIVLNIAPDAVRDLHINNDWLSFSARFAGKPMDIFIPVIAVQAIYSKENNEGMFFPEEDNPPPPPHSPEPDETVEKTAKKPASRPSLKVVK
ncbi:MULTISPECIES: ClpXP protease specificity-enhancing factor [Methylophaga]|jgi:stringent starvation protein B|uniref:ClpXP protease specificity-enhancing factor n=1 Tax=Methylophaga marina TaxID=45495 RepID=A0ABN0TR83_9GAMM|nr:MULTISPECIES: ClpXP protease specificity-enhancing factor [Methylophaga]MAX53008.1 ClpXP protease specificity-enhancing factor [Methylophaga sp.]BDZ73474.1 stringent starvation protein B [Methylophaga marina]|tara:strand:- start:5333 stop:5740 length:408 start_codon:yes stop_codon:yes gene_type:complete